VSHYIMSRVGRLSSYAARRTSCTIAVLCRFWVTVVQFTLGIDPVILHLRGTNTF